MRQVRLLILLACMIPVFVSSVRTTRADCGPEIRSFFHDGSKYKGWFKGNEKGKAQLSLVQRYFYQRLEAAKVRLKSLGKDFTLEEAIAIEAEQWKKSIEERLFSKKKSERPSFEEMLAAVMLDSPSYARPIVINLESIGLISKKVMATLFQMVEVEGKKLRKGDYIYMMWKMTGSLAEAKALERTAVKKVFRKFFDGMVSSMHESIHPESGFREIVWEKIRDAYRGELNETTILDAYYDKMQEHYLARKEFIEKYLQETNRKPRPEVLKEFSEWGVTGTVYRRLLSEIANKELYSFELEQLVLETKYYLRPFNSALATYLLYSVGSFYVGNASELQQIIVDFDSQSETENRRKKEIEKEVQQDILARLKECEKDGYRASVEIPRLLQTRDQFLKEISFREKQLQTEKNLEETAKINDRINMLKLSVAKVETTINSLCAPKK